MPAETIFRIQIKVNQVDDLVIAEATAGLILYLSRVMVPMGGSTEVFTSKDEYEPEQFNYANVRKATYRGT